MVSVYGEMIIELYQSKWTLNERMLKNNTLYKQQNSQYFFYHKQPSTKPGFSLIEFLVALTIICILLQTAIPTFKHFKQILQKKQITHLITQSFQQLRITSLQNYQRYTLCGVDSNNQCSRDWRHRILIFQDLNHNRSLDTEEPIVANINPQIQHTQGTLKSNRRYYLSRPNGSLASMPGSIYFCPNQNSASHAVRIVISRIGRIRNTEEDNKGKPIRCS